MSDHITENDAPTKTLCEPSRAAQTIARAASYLALAATLALAGLASLAGLGRTPTPDVVVHRIAAPSAPLAAAVPEPPRPHNLANALAAGATAQRIEEPASVSATVRRKRTPVSLASHPDAVEATTSRARERSAVEPLPHEQPPRPPRVPSASSVSAGPGPLSAQQLSSVLRTQRTYLQFCYERALRQLGPTGSERVDLEIDVSAVGEVTNVRTTGSSNGGIEACIARSARSWRFPAAGATTHARFPLVFQPGLRGP